MNIKKYLILLCTLLLLAFSSCTKEELGNHFILKAEGFTSSQKASVEGKFTYWLENDNVLINNNVYSVHLENNDADAKVSDVVTVPNHTYYAVYPASVYVHDHDIDFNAPFTETRTESENWTADDDEGFWLNSW